MTTWSPRPVQRPGCYGIWLEWYTHKAMFICIEALPWADAQLYNGDDRPKNLLQALFSTLDRILRQLNITLINPTGCIPQTTLHRPSHCGCRTWVHTSTQPNFWHGCFVRHVDRMSNPQFALCLTTSSLSGSGSDPPAARLLRCRDLLKERSIQSTKVIICYKKLVGIHSFGKEGARKYDGNRLLLDWGKQT